MTTTLIRGGVPDLIAGAFYHLGFRPRESVILIGLQRRGTRFRSVGPTLRVDVPIQKHWRPLAREMAETLARTGCELALVVLVTEADARALGRALRQGLRGAGLRVVEVVHLDETRYWSLDCRDGQCCPPGGRPVSEIFEGPGAAAFVASGATLVPTEAELIADVAVGPMPRPAGVAPRHSPEQWLEAWFAALEGAASGAASGAVWGASSPPSVSSPPLHGFGEAMLNCRLRDCVLLTMSGGSREEAQALLRGEALAESFMSGRPDSELLDRGTGLLAGVARTATTQGRVEALATLGWLAWWRGSGARARLLVAEALGLDSRHRLALLVDSALIGGLAPPWTELAGAW